MKQETGKKNNKWLLPVIIIAALLVIAGIVVAMFMLGGNEEEPAGSTGVQAEIYWNVDRKAHLDAETALSIREPGEDGLYHIRFAYNGELVELTANDKKLVNRIDMMDHMGLEVDANGNITNVVATADVCTVAAENFFVQKLEGGVLQVNSSAALNGMEMPFKVTEKTGIYNVSPTAEVLGGVDEPEPMDKVVVLQNAEGETTHVFIVERMATSDVYWRLEQMYNSTKKQTTRLPDAAGVYTIGFAVNGQQVDLKCKDKEIVTYIDSLANNVQCTGLTFDEQGFINGTLTPANAVRGALVSNQFDVTELTETGMTTTRMLPSANQGSTWTGNFAADCKFYDVTGVSGFVGIEVDSLKMNDRVYVLTNAMGEAQIIFITNRMVESDLYWMVTTRNYSTTTKQTNQKPDENGWYIFEFIKNGKIVKLRTKDIAIASEVHRQANNLPIGVKLDGDVITQVYHYVNVTGGWVVASGATVTSINGPIVTVMQSGTTTSLVLSGQCKITNAFDYVEKGFGGYTELKLGDQIRSFRNAAGEVIAVYVVGRHVDGQVYWNVTRKVANNQTTRTPMPEGHEYAGYYEFLLTTGGKRPTKYYTKSKKIADNIDRQYPQSVGLQVKGNIITQAVPASCVVGGSAMANYCHAEYWINEGYEFYALYRATGNGTKVKYNGETKIYNVSAGATNYVGEAVSKLQLNDQVHVLTDTSGTAKYIYIVGQTVEGEPYYSLGQTTDEKGNVTFKMLHKGKVVDLKAKDADVAAEVRSFTIGMGLHVKNGVITRAFSVASLADYGGTTAANFDIMKVSGNKLELKRTRPSASNQGQEATVELMSGIKFYDVSPYAEKPGQVVKPKVGDRVVMYLNEEGKQAAIGYVTFRHNREGGAYGKCDHCGKTVYWNHWEGNFPANAYLEAENDSVHFYMTHDRKLGQQAFVGNEAQTVMHAVLDLNGKTLTSTKRTLGAWYGATLHVLDSSKAQTGTVMGKGDPSNKDGAGVAFVTRGGSLTINGGNWKVEEEHYTITNGGIFNGFSHPDFKAGTITINGGKFYGTDVSGNGGTISSSAPEVIINGGEFFGGIAGNIGGTIACDTKLTINGGIIHGGEAKYGATISVPNLTVNGGTIEKGDASELGDCMYVSSSYKVAINGGFVEDVWVNSTWTGSMSVSGKPTIKNMTIASGKVIDMTGLTGGNIGVSASGVFTTEFKDNAAAKAAAKFVTSTNALSQISVQDKVLTSAIERCYYGHTEAEHEAMNAAGETCAFDGVIVPWTMWTSKNTLPTATGNYILANNVTTSSQTSLKGTDVVIDLNGFDITYKIPAARTANFRVFYLNDSEESNGATEGATPSSLLITDTSSTDPAEQGTVTAINPVYAYNPADLPKWEAAGSKKAIAAIETEAKAAAALVGAEGTPEYEAEYKAQYDAIYAEKYEALVKAHVDSEIATNRGYHEAANAGMIVSVSHGNFGLLGGNLDASGLDTKNVGTAIYVGPKKDTMDADSQLFLMMGGTVSGGKTTKSGGAIYMGTASVMVMQGGTVNGAELTADAAHGAAIYGNGAATQIVVTGGTINGGTGKANSNSGTVYVDNTNAQVYIGGDAVLNPGKAANGDNVYIRFGDWVIADNATVNGGVYFSGNVAANLVVTGAPTIQKVEGGSTAYSLKYFQYNNKVIFEDLQPGAKIALSSAGTVSQPCDAAELQAWIDAGYFVNETGSGTIGISDNALTIGEFYCVYGHTSHEGVECNEPIVAWQKWTSTTTLPTSNGNYYVPEGTTIKLSAQPGLVQTSTVIDIRLDLRGSTVEQTSSTSRVFMLKGATGSQYTVTSTKGQATIKTTFASSTIGGGATMLYANVGTIRLINVNADTSSVTTCGHDNGLGTVLTTGTLVAENCHLISGASKNGIALSSSTGIVTLKNTTLEGGYYVSGTATKTIMSGVVKLLPGINAYGLKGSNHAATFDCTKLAAGSEIHAANCQYSFATADAALAAKDTIIKPVGHNVEMIVDPDDATDLIAETLVKYCINGHETKAECDAAGCTEEILTWEELPASTTQLPKTPGNYYFPEGSTVNLTKQINTDANSGTIRFDLRGSTVSQTTAGDRIMLVNGGANVTFLDTVGGGKLAATATEVTRDGSGLVLYAHTGTLQILGNITVDGSTVKTNIADQAGGAIFVNTNGNLVIDGATVKGGQVKWGSAIYHRGVSLTLKNATIEGAAAEDGSLICLDKGATFENTTVNGAVIDNAGALVTIKEGYMAAYKNNGGQANLVMEGAVVIDKLEQTNPEAWAHTTSLSGNYKLTLVNGSWGDFATVADAQAAIDAGKLLPAEGVKLVAVANGTTLGRVEARPLRCIYGHTKHEGDTAGCTEDIVDWKILNSASTKKLPVTNGNYYFKDGATVNLTEQGGVLTATTQYNIRVDLRGATVNVGARMLILKGAEGSSYTITSTNGVANLKTTKTTNDYTDNGLFAYANIGTIRMVNLKLDSSSITTNTAGNGSIAYILANGKFIAENCEMIGGATKDGRAIQHNPSGGYGDGKPVNLILKNSSLSGGYYCNGSATKTVLEGVVKLLPGVGTYGIMGSSATAEFDCSKLATGSELVAANCIYNFGTTEAATAANNTMLKAVTGATITANGAKLTVTAASN